MLLIQTLWVECKVCLSHARGPMQQNLFLVMAQSTTLTHDIQISELSRASISKQSFWYENDSNTRVNKTHIHKKGLALTCRPVLKVGGRGGGHQNSEMAYCLTSWGCPLLGTLRYEYGDGRQNVAEKVNWRSFNLHRDYSKWLTLSKVDEPS